MRDLGRIVRGVRRRMARVLDAPLPPKAAPQGYYPQVPSCQIPTLGFLLARFLGERVDGTFVEVGANDGVFVSNTWGLAERGWTGWMVEPVPTLAEQCRANHASHQRVSIHQVAIAGEGTTEVRLMLAGALTTANPELAAEYGGVEWGRGHLTTEEVTVPAKTLASFLRDEGVPAELDVLVVDVEGFEGEVFSTFDFAECSPKMIIIELADTHIDLVSTAASDAELGARISDSGYRIVFKDHINTMFVRSDVWRKAYASLATTSQRPRLTSPQTDSSSQERG